MPVSAWTDDRIDRLKTLWLEGRTAEQIAAELKNGITRSAVLGKVYRMGLSAGRPARRRVRGPAQNPPPRAPKVGCGKAPQSPTPAPGERTPVGAPPQRQTPPAGMPARRACDLEWGGLDLLSLRAGQCRWPHGDPGVGVSFCGRPVARGAWCAVHAEMGYRTPPGGLERLLALAGTV